MKSEELLQLVQDPGLLKKEHIAPLEALVKEFPYFQPAHLLLTLASRKWDTSVYQRSLSRSAIVATNRTHFFNLVQAITEPGLSPVKKEALASEQRQVETSAPEVIKAEYRQAIPEKQAAESPEILEQEIGRQAVNTLVEKQLNEASVAPTVTDVPSEASFGDWLALMKKNNGQDFRRTDRKEKSPAPRPTPEIQDTKQIAPDADTRQKKRAIIDKIIESNPGLIRGREEQKFYKPEQQAKESLLDNEHLVTETLAKIYALQGNTAKAIRAYQILSLKNPQKSAYFAALIQELKNNPQP
jgi:hypothetical protein